MSRSYKKTPRCGDTKDRYMKRYANRKLRKLPLRKHFNTNSIKRTFAAGKFVIMKRWARLLSSTGNGL